MIISIIHFLYQVEKTSIYPTGALSPWIALDHLRGIQGRFCKDARFYSRFLIVLIDFVGMKLGSKKNTCVCHSMRQQIVGGNRWSNNFADSQIQEILFVYLFWSHVSYDRIFAGFAWRAEHSILLFYIIFKYFSS